ncbi:hypothetical protein ARMGADRAFT_1035843 [Armillaria gallica]|uniref:Uncharacterized protein n=1 Tax=Armillaria gallica TaxID=47427 RepID=A0A2H3DF70_ARMGA|nr:hypothetical protein ARMGADRAFT_1035843 [Armillaria gallica]
MVPVGYMARKSKIMSLVLKGIKGFKVEEEQVKGGITATEWMDGLKELHGTLGNIWNPDSIQRSGENHYYLTYYPPTQEQFHCDPIGITTSTPSADWHITLLEKEVSKLRIAQADHPPPTHGTMLSELENSKLKSQAKQIYPETFWNQVKWQSTYFVLRSPLETSDKTYLEALRSQSP